MTATDSTGPSLALVLPLVLALLALLVVLASVRRAAAKHELRTICLRCNAPFRARSRVNFAGFRAMTCPGCGATELYPLPKVMVVTYVVITAAACVAIVVKLLTDPEFEMLGGVWVVALPLALVENQRIWRVLRGLSASSGGGFVPMQRVTSAKR